MKFKPPPHDDRGVFLNLNDQPFEASLVGQMILQPDVLRGREMVKLDPLPGNSFALMAQDQAGVDALSALARDTYAGLPLRKTHLKTGTPSDPKTLLSASTHDSRAKPLRTHRDQVLLIRPDGYCAAALAMYSAQLGLARV